MPQVTLLDFIQPKKEQTQAVTAVVNERVNEKWCIFYRHCSGEEHPRCVFLSPEEWTLRKDKLTSYCLAGGKECPVLAHVLSQLRQR